ncbi:hypothetical protein F2Q68_00017368 [Brassica cretica]|uniref:Uncharacterized protein n=1 Tax=Brassica cretica TaxID=69181 RepID=A0A8S9HQ28_BRACR|nr:hypothetical protein F2Q68_00017368 [Brassica cretica]
MSLGIFRGKVSLGIFRGRCPSGTKRTKSRRGKEVAGASVPVVGDGTNPTQVLPTQTGLVNNENGEPLGPILPTEVQLRPRLRKLGGCSASSCTGSSNSCYDS